MKYLKTHSTTHFYFGLYWRRTCSKEIHIETGNPQLPLHALLFQMTARDRLYALSHIQGNTYHGFWYTSCGTLVRTETVGGNAAIEILIYGRDSKRRKRTTVSTFSGPYFNCGFNMAIPCPVTITSNNSV